MNEIKRRMEEIARTEKKPVARQKKTALDPTDRQAAGN
jgi:hypothetical protein